MAIHYIVLGGKADQAIITFCLQYTEQRTQRKTAFHLTMELYSKMLKPSSCTASHRNVLPSDGGVRGYEEVKIRFVINAKQIYRNIFQLKVMQHLKQQLLKISLGEEAVWYNGKSSDSGIRKPGFEIQNVHLLMCALGRAT